MALRMHVVVQTLDGKTTEASGPYMALADVIAFEERFGVRFDDLYVDRSDDQEGIQRSEGPAYSAKRAAFFAWRTLAREGKDVGDFDQWVDRLDSVMVSRPDGDEPVNPTELEDPASS